MQFSNKELASFWNNPAAIRTRAIPPDVRKTLYRKLQMLDAAYALIDLRTPPGNRLEALKGDRAGQYSIRVNDQFRLCFSWENGEAVGVEFCDYHK
jgi:toxin HigB-1